jgi:hypothetical protein
VPKAKEATAITKEQEGEDTDATLYNVELYDTTYYRL